MKRITENLGRQRNEAKEKERKLGKRFSIRIF